MQGSLNWKQSVKIAVLTLLSVCCFVTLVSAASTSLVRQNPKAQYAILKEAYLQSPSSFGYTRTSGEYNFPICGPADLSLHTPDQLTRALSILAFEVVETSRFFLALKYPNESWGPPLAEYEARQLDYISRYSQKNADLADQMSDKLTERVASYRQKVAPGLPKVGYVSWQTYCGDYYVPVKVVTRPPGGKIRYWSALYYRFCQRQGLSGNDITECNQWNEASDGEEINVSGAYWYQANWRSGLKALGQKDFGANPNAKVWVIQP
jgi:hypothetical protein